MAQTNLRIRWERPSRDIEEGVVPAAPAPAPATEREAVRYMILEVGVPVVEGAKTAREYAIGLLKFAAEVEHALLVQYLYAAFSLLKEGHDLQNYQAKVMAIAIQEMGHLATVQNVLLLVGGRDALYLQRDLLREESEKNPLPFVLEPISKAALAKYVAAEMPARVPPELEAKVKELVELAEQDAGVEPRRVGVIYELLKWVFSPPDTPPPGDIDVSLLESLPENPHLSDEDIKENLEIVPKFEALPEEWEVNDGTVILLPVRTITEAHDALDKVARQGEGLTNGGSSHFSEFIELVGAFEAGNVAVIPMAKAPSLKEGEQVALISHPYTRRWAEVSDGQYNLLILAIYHALVTPRTEDGSDGLRRGLEKTSIRSMRTIIQPVSDVVAALPLSSERPEKAGPPFHLDASILNSNQAADLVAQTHRLLDHQETLYKAIEESEEFSSFPDHASTIKNLRNRDKARRNLFPPVAPPNA